VKRPPIRAAGFDLDAVFDPVLPLKESAEYLGYRGKDPVKSLRRLDLERTPIAGTGRARPRFGHRLSVLNAHIASLTNPASRIRKAGTRTRSSRIRP
jgi:hypothetical protein